MERLTKSAFAKRLGVSKPAVSRMVKIGRVLVGSDGLIDWDSQSARVRGDSLDMGWVGKEKNAPGSILAGNVQKVKEPKKELKTLPSGSKPEKKSKKREKTPKKQPEIDPDQLELPNGEPEDDRQRYIRSKADSEEQNARLRKLDADEREKLLIRREHVKKIMERIASYVKAELMGSAERVCAEIAGLTDPDDVNRILRREFASVLGGMNDGFARSGI